MTVSQTKSCLVLATLATLIGVSACASSESSGGGIDSAAKAGSGGNGAGQLGGSGGNAATAGTGGAGGGANAPGSTGGNGGSDASTGRADAAGDGPSDSAGDVAGFEVISGTPDGGAYSRTGWTAQSTPPYATGSNALNMDLKYANAFDGNFNTRWSIGSANSPAQTIGDEFTFDMLEPHAFKKVLFWAGGENGVNGPDPRDYPGALDLATSIDCLTFGPTIASGNEPQPGCSACTHSFVITLPTPAAARCVRLTLTKRLQAGGPIWWAISELFVYP